MSNKPPIKPVVIAIAGGSASGKSTVARKLREALGPGQAVIINQDAYYRDLSALPQDERHKINFDHPRAFDLDLFREQLSALRSGNRVDKPVYDFKVHARAASRETVEPRPVIIVEGLFVLLEELCALYDLKVFIDTPDDLRVLRRILRDTKERGRGLDGIVDQYLTTVRPMHRQLVAPTRANADISFSWETAGEGWDKKHLNVILAGIRRLQGIMKILVIGSEGFIGGYLIRDLLGHGHDVVGYDCGRPDEPRAGYLCVNGDLMDSEALRRAADGVDLVINLAAKHHDFGIPRGQFFEINEEGTRRVLAVLTDLGIKKFVFYSSVAVYGDVDVCSHEGLPPNPSNDYGESKLAAEKLVREWAQQENGREVLVIRPTVVYGPHNYANMRRLIDNIYKHRFMRVGKGDNIKSVTYVENLTAATVFLLGRMKPGVEIYNYSDYPHCTSAQIVNFITDSLGRKPYAWHLPLKPVLMLTGLVDALAKITGINFPITANRIGKLSKMTWHGSEKIRALGFEPKITTEEGIRRMVSWYLSGREGKQS